MAKEIIAADSLPDLKHLGDFFNNRLKLPADTREKDLRDMLSLLQSMRNTELVLLGGNYRFMISDLLLWLDNLQFGSKESENEFFQLKEYFREILEGILIYCEDEYPSGYNN